MLAQRAERQAPFSRRDLGRLLVAAGLMRSSRWLRYSGSDIILTKVDVKIGDVATADTGAPRAHLRERRSSLARRVTSARALPSPLHDFTPEKASAVAREQALALTVVIAPVDAAFRTLCDPPTRIGWSF